MITLFTIVMLILAVLVIFECVVQRKVPSSLLEWIILFVAAILLINNLR